MNWSRSTKVGAVAATAVGVVGGIYLLMRGVEYRTDDERDDIEEESIASEDEARLETQDQSGHGDQAATSGADGSELDEIEQLLHLLRVSLRVKQNEKTHNAMCVALRELSIRTRYAQNVEAMLDSDLIQMLTQTVTLTQTDETVIHSARLIGNLSSSNRGQHSCAQLLGALVDLAEYHIKEGSNGPLCEILPVLSNLLFNPSYDEAHNEKFESLFALLHDSFDDMAILFDYYILRLAVNISTQPKAASVLLRTAMIDKIESEFNDICSEKQAPARSECVLRCLYIFDNLIATGQWTPEVETIAHVDSLIQPSDSLSPAVVERAMKIIKTTSSPR